MASFLSRIPIPLETITPNGKPLQVTAAFEWKDFNTKQRMGTTYEVLCPALGFEKILVKVQDTAPVITAEQLETLTNAETPPMVTFSGFKGKLYQDFHSANREVKFSATADSVHLEEGGGRK